jgi:hypothetical protein
MHLKLLQELVLCHYRLEEVGDAGQVLDLFFEQFARAGQFVEVLRRGGEGRCGYLEGVEFVVSRENTF